MTFPNAAKGLPSTFTRGPRARACVVKGSSFTAIIPDASLVSHCVNAVVDLGSPFSTAPRSARHSEQNPCTSSPRNHSCRRVAGMRSSWFRMIASSAIRGSSCKTTRCPGFFLTTDLPWHEAKPRGRIMGMADIHTSENPTPIRRRSSFPNTLTQPWKWESSRNDRRIPLGTARYGERAAHGDLHS